jgi:hypothetical protein
MLALLAGWPADMAAAVSSIVVFAFVPPYFTFKWPGTSVGVPAEFVE